VLSLDYRLAPETAFPGPLEDVVAGYRFAVDSADAFGVDRARIAIMGDSAGGNLASAAALVLGTEPAYRPKLAILAYPVVDSELDRYASTRLFEAPLSRAIVRRDIRRYAPDPATHQDQRCFVMAAADLSAMPPTIIATAGVDVLRDQGEAFSERLRVAGAESFARRFDNLPHGFLNMLIDPAARQATVALFRDVGERI
jgi:acetyl esterase